jgi:hypothetical protein
MDALLRRFPQHIDAIRRLRSSDLVFAEICRDYETLIGLLPRDAGDPVSDDILESLAGLEQEIRSTLRIGAEGAEPLN